MENNFLTWVLKKMFISVGKKFILKNGNMYLAGVK